jgi:hypothetical protein
VHSGLSPAFLGVLLLVTVRLALRRPAPEGSTAPASVLGDWVR